ncbi:MAG: hypothetical protein ACK56F_00395, partial [bacterium]
MCVGGVVHGDVDHVSNGVPVPHRGCKRECVGSGVVYGGGGLRRASERAGGGVFATIHVPECGVHGDTERHETGVHGGAVE